MTQPDHSPTIQSTQVHDALRSWDKDTGQESPLHHLYLFQRAQREGDSQRQATNRILMRALDHLQGLHPLSATLLRLRYLEEHGVRAVANRFNMAESTVYLRQREALERLAEVIHQLEEELLAERRGALSSRLEPASYSKLIGVEEPLTTLRALLTQAEQPWIISLEGMGGMGKTSLADALLRHPSAYIAFHDFGWVSAQQAVFNLGGSINPAAVPAALTVEAMVETLLRQLMGDVLTAGPLAPDVMFEKLRGALKERAHLIVIDNLETMADVTTLLPTLRRLMEPTKFLLTSRESRYGESDVYHFPVPSLSETAALQLIRHEARSHNIVHLLDSSDEALRPIYQIVGGNPLALRLVVGQSYVHDLDAVLSDLTVTKGEKAEALYTYIYERSWHLLDERTRHTLLMMPFVPFQGANLDFLTAISELQPTELRRALDLLVTLNLVEVRNDGGTRRYAIHNLTRSFLHERVTKWNS